MLGAASLVNPMEGVICLLPSLADPIDLLLAWEGRGAVGYNRPCQGIVMAGLEGAVAVSIL